MAVLAWHFLPFFRATTTSPRRQTATATHVTMHFLDAVRRSLQILSRWPEIGPRYKSNRSELAGMRFWPVRGYSNYLLFYRVSARPAGLHVVRVLHGARDIPQVLE